MAAASNPLDIPPALDKKIRESVLGTLGWDKAAYRQYRLSNRPQLLDYGRVCAAMAQQYTQWSSNLMLEWHGTEDKSSYLSPYAQRQAPEGVQKLADCRLEYLEFLYQNLPQPERDVYGELLSHGYLINGCMPDIKAAYVLYKMQDVLQVTRYRVADQVAWTKDSRVMSDVNLTDMTRQLVDKELGSLLELAAENDDSLFARLLLNTAVNRALLELAEHSRLDRQAAIGMVALVRHLLQLFPNRVLPRVRSVEEVRETVATVMDVPTPGLTWRRFRGRALDNVLQRAEAVADTDQKMMQYPEAEPYRWHYVLLTTLAVAWSYCTKERHDSRLVQDNHRTHDVIDGRSQEDTETYPPNLRLYHQRQFKLLWFSGQMHVLNAERVEQEHAMSQYLRDTLRAYFCKFKGLTLKQWAKLDMLLSDVLRGSGWDQQELLVTGVI
ncbi:hypothetical protein [Ralstonia pseudosolanacearum]